MGERVLCQAVVVLELSVHSVGGCHIEEDQWRTTWRTGRSSSYVMEACIRIKNVDSVDLCYIGMVYVLKHALGTATNEVTVYVTEICDD